MILHISRYTILPPSLQLEEGALEDVASGSMGNQRARPALLGCQLYIYYSALGLKQGRFEFPVNSLNFNPLYHSYPALYCK